jgi:chitin synthase
MLVAIRGEVFDLTSFAPVHYPSVVPTKAVQSYGGTDATNLFPVQVSALCSGNGNGISDWIILSGANTTSLEPNSVYHDFVSFLLFSFCVCFAFQSF